MTGNNQININSTSSIGLRMSLQSGSINRGRGGATTGGVKRGSGKAGRGRVRPKKVQDEKKKKKAKQSSWLRYSRTKNAVVLEI